MIYTTALGQYPNKEPMNHSFFISIFLSFVCFGESAALRTCQKIMEYKKEARNDKVESSFFKDIRSHLFPASFVKPHFNEISSSKIISSEGIHQTGSILKNYIILFKPYLNDPHLLQDEVSSLKSLRETLASFRKQLRKLSRSSFEGCLESFPRNPVTEEKYNQIHDKIYRHKNAARFLEFELAKEQVVKAVTRGLDRKWIVIDEFLIEDLQKLISSPNTGNILLVSHSRPDQYLIDSRGRMLPSQFFKNISPSLFSFNVFSCYGSGFTQFYKLDDLLSTSLSIHSSRLITQSKKNKLDNKLPVKGLAKYIKKVDKKISSIGYSPIVYIPSRKIKGSQCFIDVDSIEHSQSHGLFINRRFIGVLEKEKSIYPFSCEFLGRDEHTVLISDLISSSVDIIVDPKFELRLFFHDRELEKTYEKTFSNEAGYSSSKYKFK